MNFPFLQAKERLIRIMGTFDLATGHADTFDELLDSLELELRDVLGHYREALKKNQSAPEPEPQEATRPTSRELKMTEHQGLAIGHAMADVAAKNAGSEWVAIALDAVRKHALTNKYFTTEQVRAANDDLPEPPDRRAWGAVARKAQREGLIQPHGWVRAQSLTVHGMVVTMWESKVCSK